MTLVVTAWQSKPWCCANHRLHPAEDHWCRCRCWLMTDRNCPEHGERALGYDLALIPREDTP